MIKIHSTIDGLRNNYLTDSIKFFFEEIDLVCQQNDISDLQDWFTERTFLSLYINGQIRNNTKSITTSLQEYSVHEQVTQVNGRCDALMTIDRTLFLLESKRENITRKIDDSHWNIEGWTLLDDDIFEQLSRYFNADVPFYLDEKRYDEVFLQTIVFKIVENPKDQHFQSAEKMDITGKMLGDRAWYYGCHYPKAIQLTEIENLGIEVYGSLLRRR